MDPVELKRRTKAIALEVMKSRELPPCSKKLMS